MISKIKEFYAAHKTLCLSCLVCAVVILLDQLSKHYVFAMLNNLTAKTNGVHTHVALTKFLNIVKVWNKGVSFGMFHNVQYGYIFLSLISIVISGIIINLLRKSDNVYNTLALSLILSGAIGNLIDRIRFKAVADFIDVHVAGWHWPAFNVADSAICIGVLLFFIEDLIIKPKKNNE